jgi:hypothetical protein
LIAEPFAKAEAIAKIVQSWVTTAAVIASLAFGYVQFTQLRQEQTVAHVFDMSKEYRESFLDVKLEFSHEWLCVYNSTVQKLPDERAVEAQYPVVVKAFLLKPETRALYEKLGFFYNSLGECVKAKLCDFASANTMFGDDVLTYYHNMYPDLVVVKASGYEADGIFDFIAQTKAARSKLNTPPPAHPASWKIMPSACRAPLRSALTPWRMKTR